MAAITLNAAGSGHTIAHDVSPVNYAGLTIAAGTDIGLVATIHTFDASSISSVQWDATGTPQALTLITSAQNGDEDVFIYGLLGPTTGNRTLRVTFGGVAPPDVYLHASAYDNVTQASVGAAFVAATPGTGTSNPAATITITSATGDMTLAAVTAAQSLSSYNRTILITGDDGSFTGGYAGYAAGAATVAHTFTLGGNVAYAIAGVNMVQSGGGGGDPSILPLVACDMANMSDMKDMRG
jgi:hypothetical protein